MYRLLASFLFICPSLALFGADEFFPAPPDRPPTTPLSPPRQDRPPTHPYSPADALSKMTVLEGFHVDLVASEPQIVNPIAMTFDERGRIWITESVEYPRKSAGPGRDRVKVLEDFDDSG